MTELPEKRTLYSKTHDLGNGSHRVVASMIPMHYEEAGVLKDIDMTIQGGVVNSGLYKVELMTDKIGFHAIDRASGKRISVSLNKLGNQDVAYSSPTIDGNKATWGCQDGVDIEFIFNPHQVNIFRVLQSDQSEKFAEWKVEEELGDKAIRMNDKVRGRDAAGNKTKHTVVIAPPETANNRKSYVIRDTFESRVFKRNPKTRVSVESDDVQYPVRIDPTVTITIANTANDGRAQSATDYTYFATNASYIGVAKISVGNQVEQRTFLRFPGITIPQSATINSAALKPYILLNQHSGGLPVRFKAKKLNNPNAPVNVAGVFDGSTLATNVVNKTMSTAQSNYANVDVRSIVQELVNAFDYSNEAMLFYLSSPNAFPVFTSNYISFEDLSKGSGHSAQLEIDYSVAGGGATSMPRLTMLGCG